MPTLAEREHAHFFHTYKRLAVEIERGEGAYLYDRSGKRYLDFFGGLAVNALGYGHPGVLKAIHDQSSKYLHLSNFFLQEPQIRLAERLLAATGFQRVFLCNSGTEALEGAVKLARKWGHGRGKAIIVGMSNAFHGRTFAALSLMDKPKYRDGYAPFLPHSASMAFNDIDAATKVINAETLAVVLECIQGEGGIFPVAPAFARTLNELREEFGFLIIADEIQSGVGRTGKFFGFEHVGLQPDVVLVAKAIGGGLPLGAVLGNDRVAESFTYGVHGTTFGGNPVACAAGNAVLDEVVDGGLMQNAARIGEELHAVGDRLRREFPKMVKETRGFGCMIGIDLHMPSQPYVDALMSRGILVNSTHETVLRLLPPLTITTEHCGQFEHELRALLKANA
ncbi:MAG: acetylornithine/succinylornithine family transaminase [Bacteroidetes bacterium]|nr:acetylornithine/succinylornithine family transaminase [Bacteroidota bacterium]